MPIVIEQTEAFMREHGAEMADEGFDNPYIGVSYFLVMRLISTEVADRYFKIASGKMDATDARRLVSLGETLYELRNTPGIVEFCNRLRDKSPDHAFYNEVIATRMFLDVGFRVRAIEERRRKGESFDFSIKKEGRTICVEVTGIGIPSLSAKTLRNTLKAERKQLPKNRPNVIVVEIPEAWMDQPDAKTVLAEEAFRLFNSSGRVNHVVYLCDQHNDVELNGEWYSMYQLRMIDVANPRPRNQTDELQFLTVLRGSDLSKDRDILAMPDQASVHRAVRADRPFYRWIDGFIGRSAE